MRHWHSSEEEFVYVLEGELVLRTDAGEQVLAAGSCAGFPAGSGDGHQFVNRGGVPRRLPRDRDPRSERFRRVPGRGPAVESAGATAPLHAAGRYPY